MVTTASNSVSATWILPREYILIAPTLPQNGSYLSDMLISFTVINFSSDTRVSKHQVVVLKSIQFLFLSVTSAKLVMGGEDRSGGREKLLVRDRVP